ncbi:carbohydrate ABC transporter permease [Chachezhania sediminis]|uniref:carbohydrate ABC transporter permease n=1 Tax=Chachezhania sediminis TaxID=2599291 RepID=UPI00131BA226|nr:carbohydrate ABC transporter permease [Chachezhania sediminis]
MSTMVTEGRRSSIAPRVASYLLMAIMAVLALYPLVWMALGSLKSGGEFYTNIWGLPADPQWRNFPDAWVRGGLGIKFLNSAIVTFGTLAITLPVTSIAAYAITSMDFRGRSLAYGALLLGIMIPFGVTAIPVFSVIAQLGLLNTRLALVLVYSAQAVAFSTFLMCAFFQSLPAEIEEAARLEGCTRFSAFWRVMLPLARPGLAAQAVFVGTTAWNEYFLASLIIRDPARETIPVGLVSFTGRYATDYPALFAALTMATLPLLALYLLAQKQFVAGLTGGAVKG